MDVEYQREMDFKKQELHIPIDHLDLLFNKRNHMGNSLIIFCSLISIITDDFIEKWHTSLLSKHT